MSGTHSARSEMQSCHFLLRWGTAEEDCVIEITCDPHPESNFSCTRLKKDTGVINFYNKFYLTSHKPRYHHFNM